ncbi:MAG: hypothetical protein RL403_677 [Bacteroidota bacterium]
MEKLKLYSDIFFDDLRACQDPLADTAVESLLHHPECISIINSWEVIPSQVPENFPGPLQLFFQFYLNHAKINHEPYAVISQQFFGKKGGIYLGMLGCYSLPYCYAFAHGAEVLVRSTRIIHQIGERLGETTQFVLALFRPKAFSAQDEAFLICAKVRLIHSFSRFFIRTYVKDWDPSFGKPINQEDLLGTNLAFSHIVLRGLTKMGIPPSLEEHVALLSYWKYIGELLGVDTRAWPENPKEAFELDKLIRKRQLNTSDAGIHLLHALLSYYDHSLEDPFLRNQMPSIVSFFLGKEASAALQLQGNPFISGEVLGQFFQRSGPKTTALRSAYDGIKKEVDHQQRKQFGKVLQLNLPEVKRS